MNGEALEKRLFDIAKEFSEYELDIEGGVYYRGLRPIQSNASSYKEDVIVAFLAGDGSDLQSGTCLVNVYIPDIQAGSGVFYANKERCAEVAELLETFPMYARQSDREIYFKQKGMIATFAEEEIHQHFVSLKMEFRVLNNNY